MSDMKYNKGDFCWTELMTTDTKKAKDFYSSLFGWTTQDHDMGNMTYTMFKNGDKDLGGMLQVPHEKKGHVPPHWMSYISVENVDETIKKAKSLGASVTVEATPVSDYGRFAVIQDPTGAHIAVWQNLKAC
jgi:predicted enzyme related to lactoylglutathione lyase